MPSSAVFAGSAAGSFLSAAASSLAGVTSAVAFASAGTVAGAGVDATGRPRREAPRRQAPAAAAAPPERPAALVGDRETGQRGTGGAWALVGAPVGEAGEHA